VQALHLTFSAEGRGALFPSEALRRQAVRTLARVAGADLLLFCVVDDHVHAVLFCDAHRVGLRARSFLLALRAIAGTPLLPAHVRPVDGRSHLLWLVQYCIRQPSKHDIGVHPALWSGSCFLDLVGARVLDGYAPPLREALPRLRRRVFFEHAGLDPTPLTPLSDDALGGVGVMALVGAAAAAFAAPPGLAGNPPLVVQARRVAVHLGGIAGFSAASLARALGVRPNAVHRLRHRPASPAGVDAARRYLALEARVAARPLVVAEGPLDNLPWTTGPEPA